MKPAKFLSQLLRKFLADDTTTMAASLAFYSALSLAPLMMLFVSGSSFFSLDLRHILVREMRQLAGRDAASVIEQLVQGVGTPAHHLTNLAGMAGILTVLVSASLVFGQLRNTLNRILVNKQNHMVHGGYLRLALGFLRDRALHIGLAVVSILILIASIYASLYVYSALEPERVLFPAVLSFAASLFLYVGLFTLIFRFVPDGRLNWADALRGGCLTALLFAIGKELIGMYLHKSRIGTSYGNAGSIIVLLVWVYYSALITLLGAQVISVLKAR